MDLKRVKNEEKLNLCKKYYQGGFALLPFLWFVNSVWFFREAFLRPHFEEQKQMRTCMGQFVTVFFSVCIIYVMRSILGSVLWICAIVTWVTVFQLKRAEWGPTADYMSFIIPRGEL